VLNEDSSEEDEANNSVIRQFK